MPVRTTTINSIPNYTCCPATCPIFKTKVDEAVGRTWNPGYQRQKQTTMGEPSRGVPQTSNHFSTPSRRMHSRAGETPCGSMGRLNGRISRIASEVVRELVHSTWISMDARFFYPIHGRPLLAKKTPGCHPRGNDAVRVGLCHVPQTRAAAIDNRARNLRGFNRRSRFRTDGVGGVFDNTVATAHFGVATRWRFSVAGFDSHPFWPGMGGPWPAAESKNTRAASIFVVRGSENRSFHNESHFWALAT